MASSNYGISSDLDEEMNILLLGQSGIGKSTFINSCLNYMKYKTMQDAVEKGLQVIVPAKINMADINREYEGQTLNLKALVDKYKPNDDLKEELDDENASSQDMRSYTFPVNINNKNYQVRFFDSPGLGDKTNVAQNSKNCDLILEYLSQVKRIRGFCILLKPTSSNIDVLMNNCIVQILTRLGKSTIKNVIFIFTNTRGHNVLDAYTSVKEILTRMGENNEISIPFNLGKNVFCFENECFRNMAALENGFRLEETIRNGSEISWRLSSIQCKKLFSYVAQLEQQDLMDLQLSESIPKVVHSIQDEIAEVKKESQELPEDKPIEEPDPETPSESMASIKHERSPDLEEEMNILILGESGVGKSTFINSCLNYMKYGTMQDAVEKGLQVIVPAKINMADINREYEGQFLHLEANVGEYEFNDNLKEELDEKNASMQDLPSYTFPIFMNDKNYKVKFFDTPGLGNKTNVAQNLKSCDLILKYLSQVKRIRSFCILLKPTSSNVDILMNNCIVQILTRLSKSTIKNVIFIFTNTRGQNVLAAHTSVKNFLTQMRENNDISIPSDFGKNVFCFENECFRNVAALENGFRLEETIRKASEISWKLSSIQCSRLFSYIARLEQQELPNFNLSELVPNMVESIQDEVMGVKKESQELSEDKPIETPPRRDSDLEEDIYILLVGESGVGKSTFVNSCVNYLKYPTVEDVMQNELKVLIPARINMTDMGYDEEFFDLPVSDEYDNDNNEVFEDGKAATQDVRTYVFPVLLDEKKYKVHFIDTPGVGDERGVEQDKIICNLILGYLTQLQKIHGICILLKPNNSRSDVLMNYCLVQILSKLDPSAAQNVIFIFTNTRGQNYSSGQTTNSLKKILKRIKEERNVCVPFDTKKNVFCFDNEGFRCVAAQIREFQLEDFIVNSITTSWTISYKAFWRFLQYAVRTEPHDLKKTISANEARFMISFLSEPVTDILELIQDNIIVLKQHTKELSDARKTNEELMNKLFTPEIKMRIKELKNAQLVCTHANCTSIYVVNGLRKTHYKKKCCEDCVNFLASPELTGIIGHYGMYICENFMFSKNCKICSHVTSTHKRIWYETELYQEKVNESLIPVYKSEVQIINLKEELVQSINERQQELQEEKQYILQSCAVFEEYVKKNSIVTVGLNVGDYLNYQLFREKSIHKDKNDETISTLQLLLDEYESEKTHDRIKRSTGEHECCLPEEIEERKQKLFQLKHFGQKIQELYNVHRAATTRQVKKRERYVKDWYPRNMWRTLKDGARNAISAGSAAASAVISAAASATRNVGDKMYSQSEPL